MAAGFDKYLLSLITESGGARFSRACPVSLMATAYVTLGLEACGALSRISPSKLYALNEYLLMHQTDIGEFKEPLFANSEYSKITSESNYFQDEVTSFCRQALQALGSMQIKPLSTLNGLNSKKLIDYFESLEWKNPWSDSNYVMFVLSNLVLEVELFGRKDLLLVLNAALDWLDERQSAETGLWSGPIRVDLRNAMAATFHFTFYYFYLGREIRYPDKIIDSCLKLQGHHGFFTERFSGGHCCIDYDAADLLVKARALTSHRSDEVRDSLGQLHKAVSQLQNGDGGFANSKKVYPPAIPSLAARGLKRFGLGKYVPLDKPVQNAGTHSPSLSYLSGPNFESNAFSTWFRFLAKELSAPGDVFERVYFRKLPFLGYHVPFEAR